MRMLHHPLHGHVMRGQYYDRVALGAEHKASNGRIE